MNANCYLPAGLGVLTGIDGHVKTMDYRGQLLGHTTLADGTNVFTHFYNAGAN